MPSRIFNSRNIRENKDPCFPATVHLHQLKKNYCPFYLFTADPKEQQNALEISQKYIETAAPLENYIATNLVKHFTFVSHTAGRTFASHIAGRYSAKWFWNAQNILTGGILTPQWRSSYGEDLVSEERMEFLPMHQTLEQHCLSFSHVQN